MKVLIAEDDTLSRWHLKNVLESWGYVVRACENGSQAWNAWLEEQFHLVISDWVMPEMDGIELCRRVRASGLSDHCYFILLSSRVGKSSVVQETDAGVDLYLSKPLDSDLLSSHLKVAEFLLDLRTGGGVLQRLLPMCSWCRKARIDKNLWYDVKDILPEAHFTYSICPECSSHLQMARARSAVE